VFRIVPNDIERELSTAKLAVKSSLGFFNALVSALESRADVINFQSNLVIASGTRELRVLAKPSDGLCRLVAAARAADFDLRTI